jgi:hypothetical protein
VAVGAGAGPDAARVVGVTAAGPEAAVVGPAEPAEARTLVLVLGDTVEVVAPAAVDWGVVTVAVGSTGEAVEFVVELPAPATANSPPRPNDGGPLCVSL